MSGSVAFLIALLIATAVQAADIEAGRTSFNKCKICHVLAAGAPGTVGPNLHGLFGRKAGTADDFKFSAAMKNSGITWDDKTLAEFLRDPKATVPDNRMAFPGIKSDEDLANLLAYLKQATQ